MEIRKKKKLLNKKSKENLNEQSLYKKSEKSSKQRG